MPGRRWLLVLAGLAAGAFGVLAWRLARAPIPLGPLVPRIEIALAAAAGAPVRVRVAELAWASDVHHLELRVEEMEIGTPDGGTRARIRSAVLGIDPWALLRGRLVVIAVDVIGPQLEVVRPQRGRLALRSSTTGEPLPLTGSLLWQAAPGLRRVGIRHGAAEIAVDDGGPLWRAHEVDLDLRRRHDGITVAGRLTLAVGGERASLRIGGRYRHSGLRLALAFDGLATSAVGHALPQAARWTTALDLPLGGVVDLRLDDELRLHAARLRLASTGGTVTVVPTAPLAVGRTAIAVSLDRDAERLAIDRLTVDLDGAAAELRATFIGLGEAGSFEGKVRIPQLQISRLGSCWPKGLAPAARARVLAALGGGDVGDVRARLAGTRRDGRFDTLEKLEGDAKFRDVVVGSLATLRPLTGLSGTATFNRGVLELDVAAGLVGPLHVDRAAVRVSERGGTPWAAIDASLRGGAGDALALLEPAARPPGIEPSEVRGEVEARMVVELPLSGPRAGRTASSPAVTASLHGIGVPRVVRGWSMTNGELALTVEGGRLALGGRARLEGIPVTLELSGALDRGTRTLVVVSRLDNAARSALGLNAGPLLDGAVDVRAHVTRRADGIDAVDLDLDLRDTRVELRPFGVSKPAGAPGTAHARLRIRDGALLAVPRFTLAIPDATIEARADGDGWSTVDARAVFTPLAGKPRSRQLTFRLRSGQLTIRADDAGVFFRSVGNADAVGGRLAVDGTLDLTASGPPFDVRVEVGDCTLTRAPLLARLATLGSLTGITDALSGRGIRVESLTAQLSQRGDTLTIAEGALRGPAVTLVVEGRIDREADAIDLHGTIVPAYYGINTAPARLPLIGGVIAGGKGGVFQALDFRVKGRATDPSVSVEPLSVITLPALRRALSVLDRPRMPARSGR